MKRRSLWLFVVVVVALGGGPLLALGVAGARLAGVAGCLLLDNGCEVVSEAFGACDNCGVSLRPR